MTTKLPQMPQEHPPVPPNCEYFEKRTGCVHGEAWHFVAAGSDGCVAECLCHCDPVFRGVVAAVAEVWWLKEAEKLFSDWSAQNGKEPLNYKLLEDASAANHNARLWRQWAGGEKG